MKHFEAVDDLIVEAEKIGFESLSVLSDENLVLVPGSGAKNPWEKNKQEVRQFLEESTERFQILVRKHGRTAPITWSFQKTRNSQPGNVGLSSNGNTIPLNEYTKLLKEKSEMETRAIIAEAKIKVLETRITDLSTAAGLGDDLEEDEPEPTLAERAVTIFEDHKETIQPVLQTLADQVVGYFSGSNKDDSIANILKLTKKKLTGQPVSTFELGLLQQYAAKMGPNTIEQLSDIFEGE
jgi:hypothetical protein